MPASPERLHRATAGPKSTGIFGGFPAGTGPAKDPRDRGTASLFPGEAGDERIPRRSRRYAQEIFCHAVLAGVTAGSFGIGGGMAIAPFFITLDKRHDDSFE